MQLSWNTAFLSASGNALENCLFLFFFFRFLLSSILLLLLLLFFSCFLKQAATLRLNRSPPLVPFYFIFISLYFRVSFFPLKSLCLFVLNSFLLHFYWFEIQAVLFFFPLLSLVFNNPFLSFFFFQTHLFLSLSPLVFGITKALSLVFFSAFFFSNVYYWPPFLGVQCRCAVSLFFFFPPFFFVVVFPSLCSLTHWCVSSL